jgi:hypothetical protein
MQKDANLCRLASFKVEIHLSEYAFEVVLFIKKSTLIDFY